MASENRAATARDWAARGGAALARAILWEVDRAVAQLADNGDIPLEASAAARSAVMARLSRLSDPAAACLKVGAATWVRAVFRGLPDDDVDAAALDVLGAQGAALEQVFAPPKITDGGSVH